MNTFTRFAVAAVLALAASPALAESEGAGNPFPYAAAARQAMGNPFVSDTWSAAYPLSTESTAEASSLAALEPSFGSEAMLQTASSLPYRAPQGAQATLQAARTSAGAPEYLAAGAARQR